MLVADFGTTAASINVEAGLKSAGTYKVSESGSEGVDGSDNNRAEGRKSALDCTGEMPGIVSLATNTSRLLSVTSIVPSEIDQTTSAIAFASLHHKHRYT